MADFDIILFQPQPTKLSSWHDMSIAILRGTGGQQQSTC